MEPAKGDVMNTMEITKFAGAAFAALLIFLVAHTLSESLFHMGELEEPAFSVEIEEAEAGGGAADEGPDLATLLAEADPARGEKVFKKCKACHKIEDGANGVGPHLWGVVGRDIASTDGYDFSGALAGKEGDWTAEALSDFLESPKGWASGTKMGFAGLKKPEDRAAVIVFLNEADGTPEPLGE